MIKKDDLVKALYDYLEKFGETKEKIEKRSQPQMGGGGYYGRREFNLRSLCKADLMALVEGLGLKPK
jgi:hypothetical protein